ncbi:hypothetical protein ACFY1U_39875 [Streptomyces sp. NPDC001351]|uniref:hypothetical protein n=1 Tax=Streptomyces sp. NPDC001351 TaxID=3364564 RepID=UPI0036808A58
MGTPNGGKKSEPEPTSAAFVKITTTPDGPTATASVPGKQAGRMLATIEFTSSIGGTVIGPYTMAKALESIGAGMPWQVQTVLLALAAALPAMCFWMLRHRRRA